MFGESGGDQWSWGGQHTASSGQLGVLGVGVTWQRLEGDLTWMFVVWLQWTLRRLAKQWLDSRAERHTQLAGAAEHVWGGFSVRVVVARRDLIWMFFVWWVYLIPVDWWPDRRAWG